MKNKLSILSILGVCLLLAGCNNPSNSSSSGTQQSSSSQIENSSLETSSSNEETSTSKEDSSSEQTSSESSSSEVQSSESSSIVELTTLEKLKKYINDCVDGGNYTITDSEQTRRYLPNAYYCENLYDGNMGYAEDEKGVFSYEIVNGVVNARDYLKDDQSNNVKNMYSYHNGVNWHGDDDYLIESFAQTSLDQIGTFTKVRGKEEYTIAFDGVVCLLPDSLRQSFINIRTKDYQAKCTLTLINDGFKLIMYSSSSFSEVTYFFTEIGTTEIPEITAYLEGGTQVENLYTHVSELLSLESYKISYGLTSTRYVTPNYVLDVDENNNATGYALVANVENVELNYYPITITNGVVTLGEGALDNDAMASIVEIMRSYYVPSSFIEKFALSEDKLVCEDYMSLYGFNSMFTLTTLEESTMFGYAEITANIDKNEDGSIIKETSTIQLVGTVYDGNLGGLTSTQYTVTYSDFGCAGYEVLDNYLNGTN